MKKEKIVVQISVDVLINKDDNTFDFEQEIQALFENAGYEICGIDTTASWTVEEYYH